MPGLKYCWGERPSKSLGSVGKGTFPCIGMASGFHQNPIHPNLIERTAFLTPDGHFEVLTRRMFQRSIIKALGDLVHFYAIA